MSYLVGKGASILERDDAQASALHHAAFHGSTEVVDFLVDQGAELNARDADRATPLYYAAYAGYLDTVEILIYLGADHTAVDHMGRSPHDVACLGGNKQDKEGICNAIEVSMHGYVE